MHTLISNRRSNREGGSMLAEVLVASFMLVSGLSFIAKEQLSSLKLYGRSVSTAEDLNSQAAIRTALEQLLDAALNENPTRAGWEFEVTPDELLGPVHTKCHLAEDEECDLGKLCPIVCVLELPSHRAEPPKNVELYFLGF